MEPKKDFKREETDPGIIALIKELLRCGTMEEDKAQKEIDRILKELEKYLSKAQIDMLLRRLRTRITWDELSDREKAEILGNFPPA